MTARPLEPARKGYTYAVVDAFATGPFTGNPAAVMVLEEQLPDELCLKIAGEFNLAETAFVSPRSKEDTSEWHLRWFTPDCEEKLCGHATLATTHVLSGLPQCSSVSVFTYQTRSGPLRATRDKDGAIELDFPADDIAPVVDATERAELEKKALASIRAQGRVLGVYRGRLDTIIELEMKDGVALADVEVDVKELLGTTKRGTVLTAQTASDVAGDAPVFHSRFMCPGWTLPEDPVTGSAHCSLGVLYSQRFGGPGTTLRATQGGSRRGAISATWDGKPGRDGGRMKLRGRTFTMAEGKMFV